VPVSLLDIQIVDARGGRVEGATHTYTLLARLERPSAEAELSAALLRACSRAELELLRARRLAPGQQQHDAAEQRFAQLRVLRTTRACPFVPPVRTQWTVERAQYEDMTRQRHSDAERIAKLGAGEQV